MVAEAHGTRGSTPSIGVAATRRAEARARLRTARAFVFDMDGVHYRGEVPLPGVPELLAELRSRGREYMLATNNSSATPASYVTKLARMGIEVPEAAILTSALATRDYLAANLPVDSGLYVIGSPALREVLYAGTTFFPVEEEDERPAAVVVGLDREFSYAKLKAANRALREGARFVATNTDATLPTESGLVPGAGSIVAAVSVASGQTPVVIGKPETLLLELAMQRLGVGPAAAVMIGDRLDTDVIAGVRAGMLSVLVLTGVSTAAEIALAPAQPDLVYPDLPALTADLAED
jgi:4-nitrophenyl phosphatase